MTPEPTKPIPCPHCGVELHDGGYFWRHPWPGTTCHNRLLFLRKEHEVEAWNLRASPWRKIEEAPKGESVLLWQPGSDVYAGYWDGYSDCWTNGENDVQPTHFAPMPEPPKEPAHIQIPRLDDHRIEYRQESAFHKGMIKGKE